MFKAKGTAVSGQRIHLAYSRDGKQGHDGWRDKLGAQNSTWDLGGGVALLGECCLLSGPQFANLESRRPPSPPPTYSCIQKPLGPLAGSSHDLPPLQTSSCFQALPGPLCGWDTACSNLLFEALGEARGFSPPSAGPELWMGWVGGGGYILLQDVPCTL